MARIIFLLLPLVVIAKRISFLFGNLERNKRIRLYDLDYSLSDEGEILTEYILNDSILI